MRKEVVFEFIPTLADAGAETLVKDYCILSKKFDIDILPIVLWNTGVSANVQRLKAEKIEIKYLYKSKNILFRIFNKLFGKRYVPWKLNRILTKGKSQILHIHLSLLNHAERLSEINKKIYFFYTCHNIVDYYFPSKDCLDYKDAKYLLDRDKLSIVALHDEMKAELDKLFGISNSLVVHNGIDTEKFTSCNIDIEKKRKELNIPLDAFLILHVGRFTEQKNHIFLVDVFNEIHKLKNNAFLLMVGEGELRDSIIEKLNRLNLVNNYLILSKRSDIDELLHISDRFVFPSLFEGLGIVLIEAQYSKIVTVCSDACPTDAYISNFIYPISLKENAYNWAKKIIEIQVDNMTLNEFNDYDMSQQLGSLINEYKKHII